MLFKTPPPVKLFIQVFILGFLNQAGFSQSGCRQGNCHNGYGVYVFSTGDKYEGTWKNGLMSGYGKMTTQDGDSYEGQYADDLESGLGVYFWSDGYFYSGQFEDGLKNGFGIEYNDEGLVNAFGSWVDERLHIDYYEKEGGIPFEKIGIQLTTLVNNRQNKYSTLRGTSMKSLISGKEGWTAKVDLPRFEHQFITTDGRFEAVLGTYASNPERPYYGLLTAVISWTAESDFIWQIDYDDMNGSPMYVCTVIGHKRGAKVGIGMSISIYIVNSGGHKVMMEIY